MENSFMTWRVSAVLRVIEEGLGRELLLWRSSTPAELSSKKALCESSSQRAQWVNSETVFITVGSGALKS